jgi:hypothetical protein
MSHCLGFSGRPIRHVRTDRASGATEHARCLPEQDSDDGESLCPDGNGFSMMQMKRTARLAIVSWASQSGLLSLNRLLSQPAECLVGESGKSEEDLALTTMGV